MSQSKPELSVHPDYESLSRAAAQRVQSTVEDVASEQDDVALALAGGSTPRRLYELLADVDLPWGKLHLFWGDERFVPHDHPKSNVYLVRDALLTGLDVPARHVHPMPIGDSADTSAAQYEQTLRSHFDDRPHTFDLVLLGMGGDGHIASLFPEHDPPPDDPAWVRAVSAPPRHDIQQRLTCTLSVLNKARQAYFLVSGSEKRNAVRGVLDDADPSLPATRIQPRDELVWFLDTDARPEAG